MSEISIDIKHIAKLARLEIADDELETFEKQMRDIVSMVEKLPDISDELRPDPEAAMKLRSDVAESGKFTREQLMRNAPAVKAGCLVVPKTVE